MNTPVSGGAAVRVTAERARGLLLLLPSPRVLLLALFTPRDTHLLSPRLSVFLPLSTLIVFPSDKDLITHDVDLEPEPPLWRESEGPPIRNPPGKQLCHAAVKAPCVSL